MQRFRVGERTVAEIAASPPDRGRLTEELPGNNTTGAVVGFYDGNHDLLLMRSIQCGTSAEGSMAPGIPLPWLLPQVLQGERINPARRRQRCRHAEFCTNTSLPGAMTPQFAAKSLPFYATISLIGVRRIWSCSVSQDSRDKLRGVCTAPISIPIARSDTIIATQTSYRHAYNV